MRFYRWKNAAIAVQGKDHIETSLPCQDSVSTRTLNGVFAMALGDGAGSKKSSHIGSKLITDKVTSLLVTHFDKYLILMEESESKGNPFEDFNLLREPLIQELTNELNNFIIKNSDIQFNDLASTLMFYAQKNDTFIMGHLGDGMIIGLVNEAGRQYLKVLSYPDNGEEANITFFITNENVKEHFRIYTGKNQHFQGILMMSDGPEEVLYSPQEGIHPNAYAIFQNFHNTISSKYVEILKSLLEQEISRFSYDDLSINMLYLDYLDVDSKNLVTSLEFFEGVMSKDQFKQTAKDTFFIDFPKLNSKVHFSSGNPLDQYIRSLL
jgi:hypothetical protein